MLRLSFLVSFLAAVLAEARNLQGVAGRGAGLRQAFGAGEDRQ